MISRSEQQCSECKQVAGFVEILHRSDCSMAREMHKIDAGPDHQGSGPNRLGRESIRQQANDQHGSKE